MRQTDENGGILECGKVYLFNNLWGADTGTGRQRVWDAETGDEAAAWGTDWDWAGRGDTIKSYAAAVLGWHWGWRIAGTGLPVRLDAIKNAPTTWRFTLTQEAAGGTNVSYDLWLAGGPGIVDENPAAEIMIWLHHTGGIRPIGARKARERLSGAEWDLWAGPHPVSGWPVYSFVRGENTNAASLNLMDFFDCLGPYGLAGSLYLLSVQAGVEVFTGSGRLQTSGYMVDIECG
jgi:xyloglucan-specific endo-beta-1,4-glucanase